MYINHPNLRFAKSCMAFPRIFPMDSHGISARCSCSLPATSRRCWSGWSLNDLDLAVGTSAPGVFQRRRLVHGTKMGAPIFIMFHSSRCSGKYGVATDWTQKRLMLLNIYIYGKALLSSQISWWCFNGSNLNATNLGPQFLCERSIGLFSSSHVCSLHFWDFHWISLAYLTYLSVWPVPQKLALDPIFHGWADSVPQRGSAEGRRLSCSARLFAWSNLQASQRCDVAEV